MYNHSIWNAEATYILITKNWQSPFSRENAEFMSKYDPMTAGLFWPLVLILQYTLTLSIIQHIQLGLILLLSILWAEVLGNHPFVTASGILPVPCDRGYESRPESFYSDRDPAICQYQWVLQQSVQAALGRHESQIQWSQHFSSAGSAGTQLTFLCLLFFLQISSLMRRKNIF